MTVKESWAAGQETSEKKKNYLAETGVHYADIEEIKKKKKRTGACYLLAVLD